MKFYMPVSYYLEENCINKVTITTMNTIYTLTKI